MSNDRRTTHAPAAGTTFLATDFPVLDETDLVVKRTRASVTTTLVLDLDYTLSGIGNAGGAFVTLAAASLADDSFQLDGESAADRVSDYDPEQTPSGDQLDADLNRLTHLAQENRRDIVDLKVAQGLAPQIELGVDGGAIVWRPVGTLTWFTLPGLTYPPHGHVIADVTGLQIVLDAKLPTASFTGHVHANAVASGAAGFMTGADKAKHDDIVERHPAPDVICEDQKAANTPGGTSTVGWQVRTLNTMVRNQGGLATGFAGNEFTLPAGTYFAEFGAPACNTGMHRSKLYNVTDAADILLGRQDAAGLSGMHNFSRGDGVFTLAAPKSIGIRHNVNNGYATFGYGLAANMGIEFYSYVKIWKIG